MKVRCKFKLAEIHETEYGKTYFFRPEYDPTIPEDQAFIKFSPSGEFRIFVTNPAVHAHYKVGSYYYMDTTPVPVAVDAGT